MLYNWCEEIIKKELHEHVSKVNNNIQVKIATEYHTPKRQKNHTKTIKGMDSKLDTIG